MTRQDFTAAALLAFIGGDAAGMLVGSLMPFQCTVLPVIGAALLASAAIAATSNSWRVGHATAIGATCGGLAGAFATSTCAGTHAVPFGSDVAGLVVGLLAAALFLVVDALPRAVCRSWVLCAGLLALAVGLALSLGAEVPSWR